MRAQLRKHGRRSLTVEVLEDRSVPALVAAYGFDEGSGTSLGDGSGNNLNGTINGPTWTTSGKYGNALSFDGVNDLVSVASATALNLTNGMTIEAWVKPTATSTDFSTVVMKERGTTGLAYALYATDGANKPPAGYINRGTDVEAAGTSVLALNTWSHLAVTYNASALRIYVNGTQVGTKSQTGNITTSTGALKIGGNSIWGEWFTGVIDEVRVYNTALTQTQIQTDMNTAIGGGSSTPDTTAPTVSISSPSDSSTVAGTITVSATASDNVGVAGVKFYVDGNAIGNEDTTSPYSVSWNTTGVSDGSHTLTAVARDAAGNSKTSSSVSVTVANADTTAPTVSVTAPLDSATVSGSVAVSASASDNVGVASVQFYLDGTALGSPDTTSPYSITWASTAASNGTHTLTAIAKDAAGNTATSSDVTVTVDNDKTSPTVAVTAPSDGATVSGSVTVSADASDNVGVASVQFYLDGVALGSADTSSPYSITWNSTATSNGTYTITAVAKDAAGNATTSDGVSVTVANADSTAPTVSLTAPANNATVSGSVTVNASASDNVGVVGVQFLLNGVALGSEDTSAPYSISWDTTALNNGTYTLTARARDETGNVTTSAARTVKVLNTDPDQVGQWSSVMNWPVVAINAVLLKTGKVLVWDGGPDCIGATSATLWDPATNTFTPVPSESIADYRDIFCSGQTVLADGRVLVVGGHECANPSFTGTAISEIFDPVTHTWTDGPDMAYRRWYPTVVTLPDGRAVAIAGSQQSNTDYVPIPEVYDPVTNTWTKLPGANKTIPNYNFSFVLPDGRILVAGSDEAKMATYALDVATQTWTTIDPTVLDAGSAVMYAPGKIMKTGSSYLSEPADNGGNVPSAATTYVLDMTQSSPAWQQTSSMAYARTHENLTVLPDGSVLVTGGSSVIGGVDPTTGVLPAELWDPTTQTWTTMASMSKSRIYHSTALLLPDGRVLVSGSGHNYANSYAEFSSEIYSPAYLFKGTRPTITSAPNTLDYGSSFFVGTPDASSIASVSLIRNGSVTHSFNMDQQRVPLTFHVVEGGLMVDAPADARTAPPGTYMLYVVNSNGVPSIAPFVRFPAAYEDVQAPTAPSGLTASAGSDTAITLSWTAATDNIAVAGYNVYRSTTSGFTPSAANLIGQATGTAYTDNGLAGGTYYYVVVARDANGNTSSASNEASASVTGDTTAPTVSISSPTGGTVSGTITVSASASDNGSIAGVQFYLDGVALGSEDTSSPYSISWNTATASNGSHTLTAHARDAAGNATTSSSVSVTVSNTVSTGLVAAYGFDESSGTTASDSSANALNGTITGATRVIGKYGSALSFNGTSNWVTVTDATALHLTSTLTIEAWVMPTATSTDFSTVVLKERGTNGLAYALYATDGANKPPSGYLSIGGVDRLAKGTAVLTLNAWAHLALTYDGTTIRIYVNGTQVGSKAQTGSIASSTSALRIGGNSVWGEYFKGLIDEVRIYNKALTQAQIQSDMNTAINSSPQLAAEGEQPRGSVPALAQADLGPVIAEAIRRWAAAGATPQQLAALNSTQFQIADLASSGALGLTPVGGQTVRIDDDGAGRGWFVDRTPADDAEFQLSSAPAELLAASGPAARGYDLLTVVMHELGHVIGLDDIDPNAVPHDLLTATLGLGTRRLPVVVPVVEVGQTASDTKPESAAGATPANIAGTVAANAAPAAQFVLLQLAPIAAGAVDPILTLRSEPDIEQVLAPEALAGRLDPVLIRDERFPLEMASQLAVQQESWRWQLTDWEWLAGIRVG